MTSPHPKSPLRGQPDTSSSTAGAPIVPLRARNLDATSRALADRVAAQLPRTGRLGIAFSGGVDSAVLTAAAVWTLGIDSVVPLLAVSGSLAQRERSVAHQVADQIGVQLVEVDTHEQDNPEYLRNGPDRCYFCKDELFARSEELATTLGLTAIAYGENADDAQRPDRPGARAATERGILRPLAAAGLTKDEVRILARGFALSVADKPATPCLASRIPHGNPVTPEKLRQVDAAEAAVLALGFSDCRVRHHDEIARIEIPREEFARLAEPGVHASLLTGVQAAGFRFVTVDLAGIQSGAFTLPLVQVSRERP